MKEGNHLEGLGVDGNTIRKGIMKKLAGKACIGLIWLRSVKNGGICQGGDKHFGVI
jgi:hypothetical protein